MLESKAIILLFKFVYLLILILLNLPIFSLSKINASNSSIKVYLVIIVSLNLAFSLFLSCCLVTCLSCDSKTLIDLSSSSMYLLSLLVICFSSNPAAPLLALGILFSLFQLLGFIEIPVE